MSVAASDRLFFSTDVLPERDRFAAFCEELFRNVIGVDIAQLGSDPFRGTLEVQRAGMVSIADISVTASDLFRSGRFICDGNDAIVIQLWDEGAAHTSQGAHENRIGAPQGLVIDNARVARIRTEGASRFLALTIPRQSLTGFVPNIDAMGGNMLPDSFSSRLLRRYARDIITGNFPKAQDAALFGNHIVELAAVSLGGRVRMSEGEDTRAARCAAILREIERRSGERRLNARAVAATLGITPRYVHLLLEQTGHNFSHHLLERRLETVFNVLRDSQHHHRPIAVIAAEAGFTDLSYFNRAFRRHYGTTPTDVRNAAVEREDQNR